MARYRLIQVPQFIVGAATLSAVAFIVLWSDRDVRVARNDPCDRSC